MKKILSFLTFLLIFVSCNNHQNVKHKPEADLTDIINKINAKDSTALKTLINNNNVNLFDTTGVNLLTRAVMTADYNIVKLLLDKGAKTNLINKTKTGSTPLMMASGYKSLNIAKLLLKKGADVNIQDNNGDPAIHWSAYYGNLAFTKLMLDSGAKTDLKSIHSDGVMRVALKEYNDSIVDFLIDNKISIFNVQKDNVALINAVKQNDVNSFKNLVNKENVNARDEAGNTLLIIASNMGNLSIVELLIENKADVNAMNPVGLTALNKATFYNNNKIAKYLISKGADINLTVKRFVLSPIVAAIRGNNLEMGKILLNKGANINMVDGINNFSPIMWATLYQNKEFVKLLLQYKPDLSIISKYKTTVFDMTQDNEILKLLNNEK